MQKNINQPAFTLVDDEVLGRHIKAGVCEYFSCPDCGMAVKNLFQWNTHNWLCALCRGDREMAVIKAQSANKMEIMRRQRRQESEWRAAEAAEAAKAAIERLDALYR